MVMDQVKDTNKALLFRLNTLVPFQDFVKEAAETTEDALAELPSAAFADPGHRMFPIHTAADAWLSREYFNKFAHEDMNALQAGAIRINLGVAAEFWQLPEPPALEKVASYEGKLIEYNVGEETVATARVKDGLDMTKIAMDLTENARNYPWRTRRDVARQLLAVRTLGEATDHHYIGDMLVDLQKMAGYGTGGLHDALGAVHRRLGACRYRHEGMVPPLEELVDTLQKSAKHGLVSPEMLDKTATLLDAVDRFSDLHQHCQPPEKELFTITLAHMDNFEKKAIKLPSGQLVEKTALEEFETRQFLKNDLGIDSTPEDVVEKIASLTPHKSQLVYEFLSV